MIGCGGVQHLRIRRPESPNPHVVNPVSGYFGGRGERGIVGSGAGDLIPPNATVAFEVELVQIYTVKIEELIAGDGPLAMPGDTVTLEYTVWLEDGPQLDSSRETGQPLIFILGGGQILAGLDHGVTGMKMGSKRLLTIPPELAFGDQGAGEL